MHHNPVEVLKTNDWEKECRLAQIKHGIRNPLILTSNSILKPFNLSSVFHSESIFSDINPDPTFESCQEAIDFVGMSKFDGVIAIAGGSVMDTAKVVMAFIGTGVEKISELIKFNEPFENSIQSIFLPTTHGTASEVTMWGTIWDMKNKKKCSISHPKLY